MYVQGGLCETGTIVVFSSPISLIAVFTYNVCINEFHCGAFCAALKNRQRLQRNINFSARLFSMAVLMSMSLIKAELVIFPRRVEKEEE